MYHYNGFTQVSISPSGEINGPPTDGVLCTWTVQGYRPDPGQDLETIAPWLDEDGTIR